MFVLLTVPRTAATSRLFVLVVQVVFAGVASPPTLFDERHSQGLVQRVTAAAVPAGSQERAEASVDQAPGQVEAQVAKRYDLCQGESKYGKS